MVIGHHIDQSQVTEIRDEPVGAFKVYTWYCTVTNEFDKRVLSSSLHVSGTKVATMICS